MKAIVLRMFQKGRNAELDSASVKFLVTIKPILNKAFLIGQVQNMANFNLSLV